MSKTSSLWNLHRGSIGREDRVQRLVIGGALMLLTISGFAKHIEWQGIVAFILQVELLLTGSIGWCPIYWSCSIEKPIAENTKQPNRLKG